jgi:cellulose synthase/poly-beta-1,6-N-acetylglucosamine synthase-like glycosyltransferase
MSGILFWICVAVILYGYLGYPLLLALLAATRKQIIPTSDEEPDITLLIAAYNEESCIAKKIENTLALDYPPAKLQILIAADGSDDHTPDIVRQYADRSVELSYQPQREGKMAAINRAMPAVRGEVIVFSDANNYYEQDTLRAMVAPFVNKAVGAVSGAKHILKDDGALSSSEGLYWKYEAFIKKQETRLGSCSGVNGEIFAIRKSLFTPAPEGIVNDDFYMAMQVLRKGYRVVFAPEAHSFERVSLSAADEIIRRTRINAGRYQVIHRWRQILPVNRPFFMWQVLSHKILRLFIPFFFIGAFIANLLALFIQQNSPAPSLVKLTSPYNRIFFLLQCAFYITAWIGNQSSKGGAIKKITYLPTFLVNSNLAALQGLVHYLRGNNRVLWQKVRRAEERGDGRE